MSDRLFCNRGGFHKYKFKCGLPIGDGLVYDVCQRCIKCGKIKGTNEYVSDSIIDERDNYISRIQSKLSHTMEG